MANVTVKNAAKIHVCANGPVTFNSIKAYVNSQCCYTFHDYELAQSLNELIVEKIISLGEDGVSFDPT